MLERQPDSAAGHEWAHPSFGDLLRRHRQVAGLTQAELADCTGLSTRGIADLERGARRAPHRDTVRRIAEALQLADDEHATLRAAARRPKLIAPPSGLAVLPGPRRPHIPVPLTSFIGRERELDEVCRLLRTNRLVTLAGTGGIGKTRLALEVARSIEAERIDVAVIDLTPVNDPALVAATIAAELQILEQPGRPPLQALIQVIGERQMFFVLDNCEHI